jgi:hypothetical protein
MNINELNENLPHGSGINYQWKIRDKGTYYRIENGYDLIDENGYDDCVLPFYINVPKDDPTSFRLHFFALTNHRKYMAKKHEIRDYLEAMFYEYFEVF